MQRSVEVVRAELIAQIRHIRGTLTHEMRLSLDERMDAVKLSMLMEALVVEAEQEVQSFMARKHAVAYAKFMEKILAKPKRTRKQATKKGA